MADKTIKSSGLDIDWGQPLNQEQFNEAFGGIGFPIPPWFWDEPEKRIVKMLDYYSDKEDKNTVNDEKSKILKAIHNYVMMNSMLDKDSYGSLNYLDKVKNLIEEAGEDVSWLDQVSKDAGDRIITQYGTKVGLCLLESGKYNVFAVNSTAKYVGGIDVEFISVELTKQELIFMLAWIKEQLAGEI